MQESDEVRMETGGREPAAVSFEWVESVERSREQSLSTLVQYGVELQSAAGARSGAAGVESKKLIDVRKAGGWLARSRRKPR